MFLARVLGSVVSTIKHPAYNSTKLMVVQPLSPNELESGPSSLAVDSVGAGPGETVLVLRLGEAAAQILDAESPPIRSVIVGIVDKVEIDQEREKS